MGTQPFVIVGGGISGILAAHSLLKRGIPFVGFEQSSHLGGRGVAGPHRLHQEQSVQYLANIDSRTEWTHWTESPQARIKGEWVEPKDDYSNEEKFYLRSEFYTPNKSFDVFTLELEEKVAPNFKLNTGIESINPKSKTVTTTNGDVVSFEKLIWCSPLSALMKCWQEAALPKFAHQKKGTQNPAGLTLNLVMKDPIFSAMKTVIFPFRYKDSKLRALGVPEAGENGVANRLSWLLFLEPEILEDREEVAKCVRTLKRELQKEFGDFKDKVEHEKIVYLPLLSGEHPVKIPSLELHPDIFYLGVQATTETEEPTLTNLDLLISNCRQLETLLPEQA